MELSGRKQDIEIRDLLIMISLKAAEVTRLPKYPLQPTNRSLMMKTAKLSIIMNT